MSAGRGFQSQKNLISFLLLEFEAHSNKHFTSD